MSKKLSKKNKHKKLSHVIPVDLIKTKRFADIIRLATNKSELTKRDRYFHGYALLRTEQLVEALVTLWPLAAQGNLAVHEDCAIIADNIFKDTNALYNMALSQTQLYKLFSPAKNIMPNSKSYYILKKRLFDTLWLNKEYVQLEQIIKSEKTSTANIKIETLSKLAYLQAEKKLTGSIPFFVGCVLTGAASFIVRESIYHHDIEQIIQYLAKEIKL